MSKATKRKHVTKELLENYDMPTENQQIVKIIGGRGNNLHEVVDANDEKFLVTMPTKFRRNVWIKRGMFVVVEPIAEGNKVKAEIVHILLKDHIKNIKEENKWPKAFDDELTSEPESDTDELFENPNRPTVTYSETESDSDSSEAESVEASESEHETVN